MRRPDATRGIRFRSTALVTVLLAAALLVGSLTITSVLRQRLEENLDSTLLAAASDRAALLADRADPQSLTDSRLEESLIWIGTADGEQIAQGGRFIPLEGIPGLTVDVVGTVQTIDVLFEEVYDDAGGAYAARAWWMLRWLGHEAVAVLDGGMGQWTGALETGEELPARQLGLVGEAVWHPPPHHVFGARKLKSQTAN